MPHMKISQTFYEALKTAEMPAYKLAVEVGLNPNILSKITIGISDAKNYKSQIIKIGKLLGVPATACFEKEGGEDVGMDKKAVSKS